MAARLLAVLALSALLLPAAKKTVATARGENEDLILTVTMYIDPADVKQMVGSDLGGHYFVADVKVEPKYGKQITLDRDDFVLRTEKDGERAKPFVGSQIAGNTWLVVGDGKSAEEKKGHGWGGLGASVGFPGGMVGAGNGVNPPPNANATVKSSGEGESTLEKTLDAKILPEKKITQPVSGLLYFAMEKQKMKDLTLLYGDKDNRIELRFK